jgi:hypothetical protein
MIETSMVMITTIRTQLRRTAMAMLRVWYMHVSAMPPPNPPPERVWVLVYPFKTT